MSDPITKAELIERMQSGYAAFEALLAPLSAEQLSMPGVNGEWAIKDILAHLTAWQTRVSMRLEAIARHEEPQLDPVNTDEEMDAFNAEIFRANRMRPSDEIQAGFRAGAEKLQANVAEVNESDLFEPGRSAWQDGAPLWENIAGNTFEHYEEHAPMIEAWLASQQA